MVVLFYLHNEGISAQAQETAITEVIIASDTWKGVTNADGSGLFFDIFRMVYTAYGIKVQTHNVSYNRSIEEVKTKKADLWLCSFMNEQDFALYPKWHFSQDAQYALFKVDKLKEWNGVESLRGKRVSWLFNYNYDKYINIPMKKHEVYEKKFVIPMLDNNRIDYFINNQNELLAHIQEEKIDTAKYCMRIIVYLRIYPGFANNERGKKCLELWDSQMESLHTSKKLRDLYAQYNHNWPFENVSAF
ncbi:MAG: transporter substrate-binding domain-containing protein [Chitinivibrionales bacterium]|nr:transporter substrate-binding domain-containing protein [Chitinivibrionales bacterium]